MIKKNTSQMLLINKLEAFLFSFILSFNLIFKMLNKNYLYIAKTDYQILIVRNCFNSFANCMLRINLCYFIRYIV